MGNKGQFKPGNHGKLKGTVHKKTKVLRAAVAAFVEKKLEKIEDLWADLEPKEQARLLSDLMPYAVPRLQAQVLVNGKSEKKKEKQYFIIGDQKIEFG